MLQITPHPELHALFETLGYASGFAAYKRARGKAGDLLSDHQRWLVLAAAACGALLGSRILGLLEEDPTSALTLKQFFTPSGGKTIAGGIIGAWLCVEIVKKFQGIRTRTGDLFAIPLCIGIAVGRIGCFMAGLADHTYGTPTSLPWGVNFGDGISRHPTQIYEIVFLMALATVLHLVAQRPYPTGRLFRIFVAAYLSWRVLIDFLKPDPQVFHMNLIQWSCLATLAVLAVHSWLTRRSGTQASAPSYV